jgi:hypothetical protein
MGILIEREGGVTHDMGFVASSIARAAQIEQLAAQVTPASDPQQTVDADTAAGLLGAEYFVCGRRVKDQLGSVAIFLLALQVRQVVRQVRADHDHCLGATPQRRKCLTDHGGRGPASEQRHDLGVRHDLLQKRQLHF